MKKHPKDHVGEWVIVIIAVRSFSVQLQCSCSAVFGTSFSVQFFCAVAVQRLCAVWSTVLWLFLGLPLIFGERMNGGGSGAHRARARLLHGAEVPHAGEQELSRVTQRGTERRWP